MNENPGILVVDDDENDLRMIDMAFNRGERPPTVRYLHDGGEALDYLYERGRFKHSRLESPAFILLDLHMPRVDGWEVLRQVKSDEKLKCIPIVIFSSSARDMDVRHCYDLGANAYVVKPIDFALFEETLTAIKSFWSGCNHSLSTRLTEIPPS
jgi:two-component system response regulator